MSRITLLAALSMTAIAAAAPATAQAESYSCYCEGYCGNGAIGANPDTLRTSASDSTLEDYYGLTSSGHSDQTGWTCMTEDDNYRCDDSGAVVTAGDALTSLGDDALQCDATDDAVAAAPPPEVEEPPVAEAPEAGPGKPRSPKGPRKPRPPMKR